LIITRFSTTVIQRGVPINLVRCPSLQGYDFDLFLKKHWRKRPKARGTRKFSFLILF